jgi:hypothetical protein
MTLPQPLGISVLEKAHEAAGVVRREQRTARAPGLGDGMPAKTFASFPIGDRGARSMTPPVTIGSVIQQGADLSDIS